MTLMLASVASPQEAEIAMVGGADIIDLMIRSAEAGDLMSHADGVRLEAVRGIVSTIGRHRPISAFATDFPSRNGPTDAAMRRILATGLEHMGLDYVGVHYMKVAMTPAAVAAIHELADMATRVKLIAVFFADAPPDLSLLPLLRGAGFAGAMLDTKDDAQGSLLDYFDVSRLHGFVEDCHAAGLLAGLAGSLETPDIPRLLALSPDLLGFRGALCDPGAGAGTLDLACVQAVRALIPPEGPEPGRHDVDYRLLAARGQAQPPVSEDVPVDLVFVDDLVLPVYIGAYARERNAPQNVRFAVTASVIRTGRAAEDMRDVFSYDLITDGIKVLIGSGHIALVETLAERIAAMVLGHPRVTKVVVRVQKLDTGSGTVGVQIERAKTMARAAERPVVPLLAGATGQSRRGDPDP
jgi:FolB domain-containing protein